MIWHIQSKSKTRQRRNSKKIEIINLYKDKQFHVYHRGILIDKTIYYKGRVFKRKTNDCNSNN
ncbi:50S ribosomal subunit protein L32 [Candidatus Karelsulcia muelleri]|uniref:50S ribosomal protein L32 n=1 Tax=Candidatus Karelsulcia muelleri TaxID=336810 RepID=UPI00205CB17D|nr:50S ribosomal subunit protein L32 [Candidatus Karelsulcia muelleri]